MEQALVENYKFHTNSTRAWEAMLGACEAARTSVYIEEYVIDPDHIGKRLLGILEKKAKDGVKVKLLLDWWGGKDLYFSDIPKRLKDAGVEVNFYRPPATNWLRPKNFFPRDHRKLLITDNNKAFVGGVCVYDKITDWRDTMVEFNGALVPRLTDFFEQTWQNAPDKKYNRKTLKDSEENSFRLFSNTSHDIDTLFTNHLFEKLNGANSSIKIATPYFAPSNEFLNILKKAVGCGVRVDLILSDYSKYAPYVVGKCLCGQLIEAGVNIYYYQPIMLHLKQIIVDDAWCAIGSFNMDGLSMQQNEELMLTSTDDAFNQHIIAQFAEDLTKSKRFTYEDWHERPLIERFMGHIFKPFRNYL